MSEDFRHEENKLRNGATCRLTSQPLQHARATYIATDLGSLGMPSIRTSAFAINDTGQIVGKSVTTTGVTHAFLWSNGSMTDLGTLGGANSYALGINSFGQAVGLSDNGGAFYYSGGTMAGLGAGYHYATGINDSRQIVGQFGIHAFLNSNGLTTDLGTLPGGSISTASGRNATGQVVGSSELHGGAAAHAFLYRGTMSDLGTLGGANSRSKLR